MSSNSDEHNDVAGIRRDYEREELVESAVKDNPIDQFKVWFEKVVSSDLLDPNAMTLSTATKNGRPSSRIVLLKGIDDQGFRFYTNYGSRKGRELDENPQAVLCFYWSALERQVRIEGEVEKVSREESETYFRQRPRLSQLGAWASKQSTEVHSRKELESNFKSVRKKFKDQDVPLPDFWGGYLLRPIRIEFWQGRKGRLHDRICYEKNGDQWEIFRLAP